MNRLTKVFQHLTPQNEKRREIFPLLRERIRHGSRLGRTLPESSWEEVRRILTGEAGDFMSQEYLRTLDRLTSGETRREAAEFDLNSFPALREDLTEERLSREMRQIQLETLRHSTSEKNFTFLLENLEMLCRNHLLTGEFEQAMDILRSLTTFLGGKESTPDRKAGAERAVREIGNPEIIQVLVMNLKTVSKESQTTLQYLFSLSPEISARHLVEALVHERDYSIRRVIISFIVHLGKLSQPEILRKINDRRWYVVRNMLTLLGELRSGTAVPAMINSLRHPEPRVRREAVRALIQIGDSASRQALFKSLQDEDDEVTQLAASYLGGIGHHEARLQLIRVASQNNFFGLRALSIRRAVITLGKMKAREAVPVLSRILFRRPWINRKTQEDLSQAAAFALERIGGEKGRKTLEQAAEFVSLRLAALCRKILLQWEEL